MSLTNGQEKALEQVLLQFANNEDATKYEAITAITSILHCDGEESLRDKFAMAAMIADAISSGMVAAAYIARGRQFTEEVGKPEDHAAAYFETADAMLEARKQ